MAKRRRKPKRPPRGERAGGKHKADGDDAGGRKASEKKADREEKGKPKSAARNLVETVIVVAALVLGIRYLFLEAFKIPSSSMEPTLIGHPYHGDRVLAWKPSVKWTAPERWSINVFVKHADEAERFRGDEGDKNYIKRLIGLPGERVLVAGGDIFIEEAAAAEARVARKPRSVQRSVWHTVHEGTDPARSWRLGRGLGFVGSGEDGSEAAIRGEAEGAAWAKFARNRYDDDGGLVTNLYVKRLRLRLRCPGEGCGHDFKASIRTSRTRVACPRCGRQIDLLRRRATDRIHSAERVWVRVSCSNCNRGFEAELPDIRTPVACRGCGKKIDPACCPGQRSEEVPVGDLRVSFDVTSEQPVSDEKGFVLAELTRDGELWLARLPLDGGGATVTGPHGVDARADVAPFAPAETRRVSFAHVDQTVVLALDGEEIIRQEYELSWTKRAGTPETNSVRIGLENASLSFTNLRLERDLHYLSRGSAHIVEFYSGERGRDRWRGVLAAGVPGMPPFIGSAPAVRTGERLAEDEYFFMGDNSPSSYDSRMWGTVAAKDMVGRAFFAFWPPHHVGWMP